MDGHRIGQLHRLLRQRAALTQERFSKKCGVARWKIVRLEAGEIAGLRIGDVDRCLRALDARLDVRAWYHGAAADRLLDEQHARLVALMVGLLRAFGWMVEVEVSFSKWGERGSIDVLAWHPPMRALLIVEIKSELGSLEGTLRPFDVKARHARTIARERFGWQARVVGRTLVLPEDRTARRAAARHATVLDTALPARSRQLRSWLHAPAHDIAGVWFLTNRQHVDGKRNPSAVRRVRSASSRRPEPPGSGPATRSGQPRPAYR